MRFCMAHVMVQASLYSSLVLPGKGLGRTYQFRLATQLSRRPRPGTTVMFLWHLITSRVTYEGPGRPG